MIDARSQIVIGTAQFGMDYGITNTSGKTNLTEASSILNQAFNYGIHTLDTANVYGDSERLLGDITITKDYKIYTKIPPLLSVSDIKRYLSEVFLKSLGRLDCNQIEGLFIHDSRDLITEKGEEIFKVLEYLKEKGYINQIGVSVYDKQEIEHAIQHFPIDIIQLPINIFDQRLLKTDILNQVKKKDIVIQARSVFLQGLTLENSSTIAFKFPEYYYYHKELDKYSKKYHLSRLDLSLLFIVNVKEIDHVVFGISNINQLVEIVQSFDNSMEISNKLDINWEKLAIDNTNLIDPRKW